MFIQHLPLLPLPAPDPYYIHSSSSFPTLKLCCGGFLTILLQRSNKPPRNHFSSRACNMYRAELNFMPTSLRHPSLTKYGTRKLQINRISLKDRSACGVCRASSAWNKPMPNQSLDQNVARFSRGSEATRGRREEGGGEREVDNAYRFWSRTDAVETGRQTDGRPRPLKFLSNFRGEILQNHRRGNSHFSHLPESRDRDIPKVMT